MRQLRMDANSATMVSDFHKNSHLHIISNLDNAENSYCKNTNFQTNLYCRLFFNIKRVEVFIITS